MEIQIPKWELHFVRLCNILAKTAFPQNAERMNSCFMLFTALQTNSLAGL